MSEQTYCLTGIDGNAYYIIGYVVKAMRREHFTKEEIKAYEEKAKSKDYYNLLLVSQDQIEKCNKKHEINNNNKITNQMNKQERIKAIFEELTDAQVEDIRKEQLEGTMGYVNIQVHVYNVGHIITVSFSRDFIEAKEDWPEFICLEMKDTIDVLESINR